MGHNFGNYKHFYNRLASLSPAKKIILLAGAYYGYQHAKYTGLLAALHCPGVLPLLKQHEGLSSHVGQSLGYKSFSHYLRELRSVQFLKRQCAKKLEQTDIPLNLTPTEGYLLAAPRSNISQHFNFWFFLYRGRPTAPDSCQRKNYPYIELISKRRLLIKVLNKALQQEKKHWHQEERLYPIYRGTSMDSYIHSYLNTKNTKRGDDHLVLRTPSIVPELWPEKYGITNMRDYLITHRHHWTDEDFNRNWLVSGNITPLSNTHTFGESSIRVCLENTAYKNWEGVRPTIEKTSHISGTVCASGTLHKKARNCQTGILLQIFLSADLLDQATYASYGYGQRIRITELKNLKEAYSLLSDKPVSTYNHLVFDRSFGEKKYKDEKDPGDHFFVMAEIAVTEDLLGNLENPNVRKEFKVIPYALNDNERKKLERKADLESHQRS